MDSDFVTMQKIETRRWKKSAWVLHGK